MASDAALVPSHSPPNDPPHSNWQLVLVKPAQNHAVLYSPHHRQFTVAQTYPALPHTGTPHRLAPPPRNRTPPESDDDDPSPHLPSPSDPELHDLARPGGLCPLCYQPLPRTYSSGRRASPLQHSRLPLPSSSSSSTSSFARDDDEEDDDFTPRAGRTGTVSAAMPARLAKEGAYFELLSEANSRVNSPRTTGRGVVLDEEESGTEGEKEEQKPLHEGQMNEGYYETFFVEVQLLGKGGQGSVYLARHVLNGENLGLYAVKKIRVGDSTLSLLSILREVHLLESIHHPNIISYHHAWLETAPSVSPFVPSVPTLHVLMAWANGGSLEGFVRQRGGLGGGEGEGESGGADGGREGRKERWRRSRRKGGGMERAIHLLRVEDLLELFKDVVVGLGFLHSRNILHLDLKAENVLLHWDEDALLPRCMLSDFGSATADSYHRERHGGSGTLEYTPPEAWLVDPKTNKLASPDRATDQWALGLVLHLLCFFALPWRSGEDTRELEREIRGYRGFFPSDVLPTPSPSSAPSSSSSTPPLLTSRHDLPPSLLLLLSSLINLAPAARPSCDRVEKALPSVLRDAKELEREGGAYPPAVAGEGEEGEGAGMVVGRYQPVRRSPFLLAPSAAVDSRGGPTPVRRRRSASVQSPRRERGAEARALLPASSLSEDEGSEREREARWELLPPRSPSRRAFSPSLALTHPLPSPPLALPSPPLRRALSASKGGGLVAVARSGVGRRKVFAAVVGVGKLLLLPRSLLSSGGSGNSLPTWLALLLLLETALDVALADGWVTLGLLAVHVAVVGVVGRVGGG
ncbi:hypothetical protein JCM6882_002624 [Rhodosporidiobolus microsporus]